MKKRSASLLALALCVCMAGSSLNPVLASVDTSAAIAEEQIEETPEAAEASAEETAAPEETTVPEETTAPEETEEPTETPGEEPAVTSEGTAKEIVDAREAEGGPTADFAYNAQDVTFEQTTAAGKVVTVLKINGTVPADAAGKVVGVVQEDGTVVYYAYVPSDPSGAICMDDVYKFGTAGADYYAFDEQGHMVLSGTYVYKSSANQNTFCFLKNGKKKTVSKAGYYNVEGIYYSLTASGAIKKSTTGFKSIKVSGTTYKFYFLEGVMMQSSLVTAGNYMYYLDDKGHMATGRQEVDGKYYFFRKKAGSNKEPVGSAVKGWQKEEDYWYYYKKYEGIIGPGIFDISSKSYYFTGTGKVYRGGRIKNDATENKAYFFKKQTDSVKPYMLKNTWVSSGSNWYYADTDGTLAAGKKSISNKTGRSITKGTYYFDEETNKMLKNVQAPDGSGWLDDTGLLITTGWIKMNGNWRYLSKGEFVESGWQKVDGYYYWFKDGYLCQDLRNKYKNRSGASFRLDVNRKTCTVTVLTKSTANNSTKGKYVIPVVTFRCSVGLAGTPTPKGSYRTWHSARWKLLMGPSYGQYGMGVVGGIYFHSVACPQPKTNMVPRADYNRLGNPASHGCIRLCVRDVKWLWDNCNGAYVKIFDKSKDETKFAKPALVKMKGSGTYGTDPTDPSVKGSTAPTHINPY